jgi:hypothetical protein
MSYFPFVKKAPGFVSAYTISNNLFGCWQANFFRDISGQGLVRRNRYSPVPPSNRQPEEKGPHIFGMFPWQPGKPGRLPQGERYVQQSLEDWIGIFLIPPQSWKNLSVQHGNLDIPL